MAIIGGGPAGLTAAYLLSKETLSAVVIESDPKYVGGISRTATYKEFHFDIGGHRFFSKSKEVEDFWDEILPHDMLTRPRSSRIYYKGKFFAYPLKPMDALFKLGIWQSILCVASYLRARLHPIPKPANFQEWVTNQFGKRLFNIFFKTYTEKVWGIDCKDISADWAAQRIKGLSLGTAIINALLPQRKTGSRGKIVKTLIESFRYPRKGPGMMWEACAAKVQALGGQIRMGHRVTACYYDQPTRLWTVTHVDVQGNTHTTTARHLVSSAPIRRLARILSPPLSTEALHAASALKYRDFLTVVLICKHRSSFTDNWIYIHEPNVSVGRIQNFRSWSPEMVPDESLACYGLEYFCFEGDGLWTSTDPELIELAKREIAVLGLANPGEVQDGCVVRQPKAYPVYDDHYASHVATVRTELESRFPTLHLVGRNGMHKYNNQDHSMMTAMLTVKNIIAGEKLYDVWSVNEDAEYHETVKSVEESGASGLRLTPKRASANERQNV